MSLIGICGAAGCGKDTLANHISECTGIPIHRMADPLKRGLEAMFGWEPEIWDDRYLKEEDIPGLGRSPRYLAQTIGTEWGRDLVHPDIWVMLANKELFEEGSLIIPDVRFANEAQWINNHANSALIEIIRPDQEAIKESSHSSENGIDPKFITHKIINDGTIDDLERQGMNIMLCRFGF